MTIVKHAHQPRTAALNVDVDRTRARIERVLDDFLDEGRRTLDHFAGGDLVNQRAG